jgi:hypothetical protein
MRVTFLGTAAAAAAGLMSFGSPSRSAETMLLGGVGSLSNPATTAPVVTLQADATTEAETLDVHFPIARGVARVGGRVIYGAGRLAVGSVRYAAGYPFYRPWYGGYRPWGWARPWYGFYRPYYGWHRPWYYPGAYVSLAAYPTYYAGYSPVYYSSAIYSSPSVVSYGSGYGCECVAAVRRVVETAPTPLPNGGYRYDGGPANPVPAAPMPKAVTPPATTPPPPTADAVARRPAKKHQYPAYGEKPAQARPTWPDPLLVKGSAK